MANLSQESSHSYLVYPSQSLACSNHPLDYLSIDNQKLFSDGFGEWSEKTDSNLSAYDLYSANNVRAVIPEIGKESFSFEESENCVLKLKASNPHFSNQSLYCNEDQDMSHDEYLESMTFYPNYEPFVAAAFTGDSRSLETTSGCFRSMCSQSSGEESPLGVEQFQLFSEVDDGPYCMENFGVQQSLNSYNKRPYVGGDLIESPSAKKKQCANGTSPRRLTKPNPSPSKDPQSIAAKNRRERISERLKILQDLVPNGTKVDLVTMLEKAVTYVKFLQLQVKVLATDEFWPNQGGKAPEVGQVKEAIDAILSSHKEITSRTKKKVDD